MKPYLKSILFLVLLNSVSAMAQIYDSHGNAITIQRSQAADSNVTSKNTVIYPSTSVTGKTNSFNVLIDLSKPRSISAPDNSSYDPLIKLLNNEGYSVNASTQDVLSLNLNEFDVIVLGSLNIGTEYSQSEINALKAYVDDGGSLIIQGEASRCNNCAIENQFLSDISKPIAGLSFSPDVTIVPTRLYFSNLTSHEIFTDVNQLYYQFAGAVQVDSPEYSLAKTDDGLHTLVALNNNVIALSDSSFLTSDDFIGLADNTQFIKNMFDYLATGTVEGSDFDTDLSIEKRINFFDASNQAQAVNLVTGDRYQPQYTVTNNFDHRVYQVNIYDERRGNEFFVCALRALAPGQSKSCEGNSAQIFPGLTNERATVRALSSQDGSEYVNQTDGWYIGHPSVTGDVTLQHRVNNQSADSPGQAAQVKAGDKIDWLFTVKNNTNIDIYRTRLYADPVTPVNTGWEQQCFMGNLRVGVTRHCKVTTIAGEGLHHVIGRVRSLISPVVGNNEKVGADNPTYYFGESTN